MKKLAIIGASYLQEPLIQKAKRMGLETHVFAWAADDVGEKSADHFHPISIVEKDAILAECRRIGIDGICSIASDLAAITVNHVAWAMGLTGNTPEATVNSTNKHQMRLAFQRGGDPSPKSTQVEHTEDLEDLELSFPVIVKPTDRSGSRGIWKVEARDDLKPAVENAMAAGFEKKALIEEYAEGQEFSVECISWQGIHHFLAMTRKFTTAEPHFIETGHLEPAVVTPAVLERVKSVVFHALDSLGLKFGASHSELKLDDAGNIRLIEIGGRMGGDLIGSDLVEMSTGVDFVRAVIDVALGREPELTPSHGPAAAAIRFLFDKEDMSVLERLKAEHPAWLRTCELWGNLSEEITDSSNRHGYFLFGAETPEQLLPYLPGFPDTDGNCAASGNGRYT